MRTRIAIAVLVLAAAVPAAAQSFFGRALLEFQKFDYGATPKSGFRQQYDVRLSKALSEATRLRIFVRADDFRGTTEGVVRRDTGSRQIQPMADLLVNTLNFHVQAHGELIDTESTTGTLRSERSIERTYGTVMWTPEKLPALALTAHRTVTSEAAADVDLTDEYARAALQHEWRGLSFTAEERYAHNGDPRRGYDRVATTHAADLGYSAAYLGGKLSVTSGASVQLMNIDEKGTGEGGSSVPVLVPVNRALWSVDDTPLDSRDHPAAPNPALTDANTETATGISLGPDGVSFQNLVLDIGRVDRIDEVRVVVRDGSGNPLRNGGGPVTWDVYTSADGQLWTLVPQSRTEFSTALSLYVVTFDLQSVRWLKVVNFGVNLEATLVTEIQAYYHTAIGAGQNRSGTQNLYAAAATISAQPTRKLAVSYTAAYARQRQELAGLPFFTTSDLEHIGAVQYDLLRTVTLRGQFLKRLVRTYAGRNEDGDDVHVYADYRPTPKATITLELGRQSQVLEGYDYTVDTRAVHFSGFMLQSIALTLDVGSQRQTVDATGSVADRTYANLTGTIHLLPSLRTLITGTMQRTKSDSLDPALQILGPARDNRVLADFIYRPGRPLQLSARFGYVSSESLSGFTQRYHAEWYPFGDGTVSLGGSYDEDIDPAMDRRARRVLFNPRWMMNRWATLDLTYMAFTTTSSGFVQDNRTFYATLTLTR